MALTPTELYAVVKPLWKRDKGFKPDLALVRAAKRDGGPFWWCESKSRSGGNKCSPASAAALVGDQIIERLGELAVTVAFVRIGRKEYRVDCKRVADNSPVIREHGPDRTLCLIAAAMKATEPARVG